VSKITDRNGEIEAADFASEIRHVYFGEQAINLCAPLLQRREDVFAQAAKLSDVVNAVMHGARVVRAQAQATKDDGLFDVACRMLGAAELASGIATMLVEEIELAEQSAR
jgi:hypothetical protein